MKIIIADRILSLEEVTIPQTTIDLIQKYLDSNNIEYLENEHYDENLEELALYIIENYISPLAKSHMPNLKELVTWHDSVQLFDFLNDIIENQPHDGELRLIFDVHQDDGIVIKYLKYLEKIIENIELNRGKILDCSIHDSVFIQQVSKITIGTTTINHSDLLNFYTQLILKFYICLSQMYTTSSKNTALIKTYIKELTPAINLTASIGKNSLKDFLFAGGKYGLLVSHMSSVVQFIQTILNMLPNQPGTELKTYIGDL